MPSATAATLPTSTRSAYLDEAGQPRLRNSIVGFLDILGFSQSILATREPSEAQRLLEKIVAAIADSRQYVREDLADELAANSPDSGLKFFSDNLVVAYSLEGHNLSAAAAARFILRSSQRYQLRMAVNGFFLRGALALGPICLTDDLIFGAALLECYQLESKAAIVPRVILAESLADLVASRLREPGATIPADVADSICRDIDGWWFVNYLEAASSGGRVDWDLVERHKQAILSSMAGTTRHDVLPKFGWICRYHNMFCHWHRNTPGYSERLRIDRVDERSTIYRLSEASQLAEKLT